MHQNDEMYIDRRSGPSLSDLMSKIDRHFLDENRSMMEFAQKVSSIESDMKVVSESMRKMSEVLERLALAEERDKTQQQAMLKMQKDHVDLEEKVERSKEVHFELQSALEKLPTKEEFTSLKETVHKWIYVGMGVGFCLTLLGGVAGSFLNGKLVEYDTTINQAKTHMSVEGVIPHQDGK